MKNTDTAWRAGSILGPLAPQTGVLPLDHCDLLCSSAACFSSFFRLFYFAVFALCFSPHSFRILECLSVKLFPTSAGVRNGVRVSGLRPAFLDEQSAHASPGAAAQCNDSIERRRRPQSDVRHLHGRLCQRTRTPVAPCRRPAQRHEGCTTDYQYQTHSQGRTGPPGYIWHMPRGPVGPASGGPLRQMLKWVKRFTPLTGEE